MKKIFTKQLFWVILALFSSNALFAQYSNATLNGPWFTHTIPMSPYNDSLNYFVFDGNGLIIDMNGFGGPITGTYSVTSGGAITGNLVVGSDNYPISGQLVSQNVATSSWGILSRITNPGALADTLVGTLHTDNCGQKNVTIFVNSQGLITSTLGLAAPVTGRIYADSGVFLGHLKTGETSNGWNELSIMGYINNNSLTGQVGLDNNSCGNSVSQLVRNSKPTSIQQDIVSDEIIVYHDLSGADLNIIIPDSRLNLNNLELFDITGRTVFSLNLKKNGLVSIPVSGLKQGIYLVKVTGDQVFTKKVYIY